MCLLAVTATVSSSSPKSLVVAGGGGGEEEARVRFRFSSSYPVFVALDLESASVSTKYIARFCSILNVTRVYAGDLSFPAELYSFW